MDTLRETIQLCSLLLSTDKFGLFTVNTKQVPDCRLNYCRKFLLTELAVLFCDGMAYQHFSVPKKVLTVSENQHTITVKMYQLQIK